MKRELPEDELIFMDPVYFPEEDAEGKNILLIEGSGIFEDVPTDILENEVETLLRAEEFRDEDFSEEPTFETLPEMDSFDIDVLRNDYRKQRNERWKKSWEAKRKEKEIPSLLWLAKEIKIDREELAEALILVRNGKAYRTWYEQKPNGGKREICAPCALLMKVQKRINRHVLKFLFPKPRKNAFGFSGGSIVQAIEPHLRNSTMLCVDFMDAFPTVGFDDVLDFLTTGRRVRSSGYRSSEIAQIEHGWFSWYAAMILTELMTYQKKLPQGAPTSPRMFDLLCEGLDKKLAKLAANVGGAYTRYADNVFFSINQEEFPRPLRQAILKMIEGRQFTMPKKHKHKRMGLDFNWHKLKIVKINGKARKILGLNIINGKIHNTRGFKKRLRLSIHHVKWMSEHGMRNTPEFETAWQKLCGQIQFARTDTLPPKIMEDYLVLQQSV